MNSILCPEVRSTFNPTMFHAKYGGAKSRRRKWSNKYKKSINCRKPKGFSQKQHCKYGRKKSRKFRKTRSIRKLRKGGISNGELYLNNANELLGKFKNKELNLLSEDNEEEEKRKRREENYEYLVGILEAALSTGTLSKRCKWSNNYTSCEKDKLKGYLLLHKISQALVGEVNALEEELKASKNEQERRNKVNNLSNQLYVKKIKPKLNSFFLPTSAQGEINTYVKKNFEAAEIERETVNPK